MTGFGRNFRLPTGKPAQLGRQLGKGGEGSVFEIEGDETVVAKIYTKPISQAKAAKLAAMVRLGDESLLKFAAWPLATIGPDPSDIRGFVMPRLHGYRPLHDLYNPASRRATFPHADWKYLVHSARNLAAAVAAIHDKGCVVGDLNQGNAWVHETNALTALIDCDSFQISATDTTWLCEVGVGHFTPPEMQDWHSFTDHPRVPNHDGFGLAVLIFHLLFFGRHPYSGVYPGHRDVPLEQAIKQHWFAYSSRAKALQIAPPPGTAPLAVIGDEVASLFEQAFGSAGTSRPSPAKWVSVLDTLEHGLKRCTEDAAHVFPGHLPGCPWCDMEERTGALLFVSRVSTAAGLTGRFNLSTLWSTIESITLPPAPSVELTALPPAVGVIPAEQLAKLWTLRFARFIAIAALAFLVIKSPAGWLFWGLLGFGTWHGLQALGPKRELLLQAVKTAETDYNNAVTIWTAKEYNFADCEKALNSLKAEYQGLPGRYKQELAGLQKTVYDHQRLRFLERFLVRDASIQGVKEGRKQTLQSFGIQTAADATRSRVGRIPGFGPVLTDAVADWRARCEAKFVFDNTKGVDPADIAALNKRYEHMRRGLEDKLQKGTQELLSIRDQTVRSRKLLHPKVVAAGIAVLQARANLASLDAQ
jgi:DNA-binding helix-hairpin-helix protein with protein kinase domain